ncbi:MAG: tetratricopeptide repeat protein, partial [bacterium]
DPLRAAGLTGPDEEDHPLYLYLKGAALRELGLYGAAAGILEKALRDETAGTPLWQKALVDYVSLLDFTEDRPEIHHTGIPDDLTGEASLALAAYRIRQGELSPALELLDGSLARDSTTRIQAAITAASLRAATGNWDSSLERLGSVTTGETSAMTDLLYLVRGYALLQSGQPGRARESFLTVPPSSPFAPEALFGHAWSLIRSGDLEGAVLRLEELSDTHRRSSVIWESTLDLALCYRELGLYDLAGQMLEQHLHRIREATAWFTALRETELGPGSNLVLLVEHLIRPPARLDLDGSGIPDLAWSRIGEFSTDPIVRHSTALLRGIELVLSSTSALSRRLEGDLSLVQEQIRLTDHEILLNRARMARMQDIRGRLVAIDDGMRRALQDSSLDRFGTQSSVATLSRIGRLKGRLDLIINSAGKADAFSELINSLEGSVTVTELEAQLNLVRKQAYLDLVSSRRTLKHIRSALTGLEGQLWLSLKGHAVRLEQLTSGRVASGNNLVDRVLAGCTQAESLLIRRRGDLDDLAGRITAALDRLDAPLKARLDTLADGVALVRSRRLMALSAASADELHEMEARTLYTAADIEISRMEDTVRVLREALQ